MKTLLPNGSGAFYVHKFSVETEDMKDKLYHALISTGAWSDATEEDYIKFTAKVPKLAVVLLEPEEASDSALTP